MSAPIPPANQPLDPLVQLGHTIRDRADIVIAKHRAVILLLVCAFAFAGWRGYVWHVERMERLEAQAGVEKTKATNEQHLSDAWRSRALALVDSVRIDTVTVRRIISHVKVDTLLVPAAQPAAQDGVTYSEPQPLVPLEVVSKLAFDSLGAACTRVEHDCTGALAAKDSVIAHQDSAQTALAKLNANTAKQLTMQKHATTWAKILWGLGGLLIGRVVR